MPENVDTFSSWLIYRPLLGRFSRCVMAEPFVRAVYMLIRISDHVVHDWRRSAHWTCISLHRINLSLRCDRDLITARLNATRTCTCSSATSRAQVSAGMPSILPSGNSHSQLFPDLFPSRGISIPPVSVQRE